MVSGDIVSGLEAATKALEEEGGLTAPTQVVLISFYMMFRDRAETRSNEDRLMGGLVHEVPKTVEILVDCMLKGLKDV